MRPSTLGITLACALLFGCAASPLTSRPGAQPRLQIGAERPHAERSMVSAQGGTASIAGVAGKEGTLVVFMCNHCPWSRAWQGRIVDIAKTYAPRGIGTIALNPNDPGAFSEDGFPQMQERALEAQMDFPYVVDAGGLVARAFGVQKTPEAFLFGPQGRLVYAGAVDDSPNDPGAVQQPYLKSAIEALLDGRAVEPSQTRTFGCAILPME